MTYTDHPELDKRLNFIWPLNLRGKAAKFVKRHLAVPPSATFLFKYVLSGHTKSLYALTHADT